MQLANILFSIDDVSRSVNPRSNRPNLSLLGIDVDDTAPRYLLLSQQMDQAYILDDVDSSRLVVRISEVGGGTVASSAAHHLYGVYGKYKQYDNMASDAHSP